MRRTPNASRFFANYRLIMKLPKNWIKFKNLSQRAQRGLFLKFLLKTPTKRYLYSSNRNCLVTKFGNSLVGKRGGFFVSSGGVDMRLRDLNYSLIDTIDFCNSHYHKSIEESVTFGDAYKKITKKKIHK